MTNCYDVREKSIRKNNYAFTVLSQQKHYHIIALCWETKKREIWLHTGESSYHGGVKRPGREAHLHLVPMNAWSYISAPPYVFNVWYSVKHRVHSYAWTDFSWTSYEVSQTGRNQEFWSFTSGHRVEVRLRADTCTDIHTGRQPRAHRVITWLVSGINQTTNMYSMEYTCLPCAFFAILHTSLTFIFGYSRY